MLATRFVTVMVPALALMAGGLKAQSVISAHSGVLHYYEGDVTVDGQVPHQKPGTFADVKQNQQLETQAGRAEVLLTPGAFLRVGENSAIRMTNNKLTDTQVEFVKGSALVDLVEVAKDNQVTVNYEDYKVTFAKRGIYRFDSEPAEVKVYTGEATITRGTSTVTLKDGRAVPFTPALISEKFDNKTGDSLYRWAKRRSEYIAVANLSAARQAGTSTSFTSTGTSGWYYNPYYSMFTFIPGRGTMCDPMATFLSPYSSGVFFNSGPSMFGCYYSPMGAWNYFSRPYYNYGNYGGGGYLNNRSGYASSRYPTSIGTSSALAGYAGSSSYASAPSVGTSSSSGFSGSSSGFSSGGGSRGGGYSGGGGGGGGGGGSHGGGSGGGHGK